ncbi:hypothetical protein N7G274_010710 [Stereocaulon virgatum]|uniref:Retrotransposon gag domain-containing protein n=1 Tax=Stereocaulon virgatum TaxID=373712 RepID=A0ABR3ZWY6_9LECA
MASATRSGKQASATPTNDSQDTSDQQLIVRAFSPEQESQLDERFNSINAAITASNANMANAVADLAKQIGRLSDRLDRQQQTSSPVLPSIEPSPPPQASADPTAPTAPAALAAPTAPPPPAEWHPYKRMLKAEDVGYFDPGFQASEQEHGKSTPGPVVNAGKHAYYLDIFVFVDRLNELSRKYGPYAVQDVIPSCLRGSALTWWTTEVDHSTKTTLEASTAELQPWIDLLIKAFRTNLAQALAAFTASRYTLRELHMAMTPKTWIHGQLTELPNTIIPVVAVAESQGICDMHGDGYSIGQWYAR